MTEIRARLGVFSTAAVAGLAGIGLLLAGCGSSAKPGAGSASVAASSSSNGMSPGMSMAPGESMAPAAATTANPAAASSTTSSTTSSSTPSTTSSSTPQPAATNAAASKLGTPKPSKTALMVCSEDISGKIRSVLKLAKPAPTTSTFKDGLFSCSYTLPQGKLVLSVKQSSSDAAAGKYFDATRLTLPATHQLLGLGERAYATNTGVAVVIKDDQTLRVDATGLPSVFGSEQQKRTDLAYEVASDVLGCWTGDE